eukprot:gnl/Ergobibamus_cyprinoides/4281.p3 GENE.gnl/Ergobibamus_cyprinoides/4281~~gnl/Ergobibamus_cyprinoides/4281.p3  ORF type:complete len:159 (+),score=18.86 gnl/Ergobibamus_cyprinoides/4281:157-633(+)
MGLASPTSWRRGRCGPQPLYRSRRVQPQVTSSAQPMLPVPGEPLAWTSVPVGVPVAHADKAHQTQMEVDTSWMPREHTLFCAAFTDTPFQFDRISAQIPGHTRAQVVMGFNRIKARDEDGIFALLLPALAARAVSPTSPNGSPNWRGTSTRRPKGTTR